MRRGAERTSLQQPLFLLVGEIDRRRIAQKKGAGSTVTLVRDAGMAPAVAHRFVRVGKALNAIPSVASYDVDGALR